MTRHRLVRFLARTWIYFKRRNSSYLAYILAILNFIVIQYSPNREDTNIHYLASYRQAYSASHWQSC